jgi:acetyl esterase/lipase
MKLATRIVVLAASVFVSQTAIAQQKQLTPQQQQAKAHRLRLKEMGIKMGKAPVAESDAIETRMDVVYAQYGDRKLHLDLFVPRKKSDKTAAIVVVHGGGWFKGDRKSFHALSANLAMRGYVTAAIEYRLADEAKFPAAIHDCNAATRWLRANAKALGVDPNRIAAVGGSAGGHLVGLMATGSHRKELQGDGGNADQSSALQAAVVFAGPMQMTTGSVAERSRTKPDQSNSNRWLGKSIDEAPQLYALAAPFKQLTAKTPPMLFAVGELDKPERNAPMRKKLRELGIDSKVMVYRYGRHACWNQEPWFHPMSADVDEFVQSVLGEPGGEVQPLVLSTDDNIVVFNDRIEVAVGKVIKKAKIEIPRLNNQRRKVFVKGTDTEVTLKSRQTKWELMVTPEHSDKTVIIETVGRPHLARVPRIVSAAADGTVVLPAHEAVTHGEKLMYEPEPHKNTVGYWVNPKDWVEWHFYTETPGKFALHVLQGCGKGHGGSEVAVQLGNQTVDFVVEDTGHFQNFKDREVGRLEIAKPGIYTLKIVPKKKAKVAIMDVRQVRLVPAE